MLRDHLQQIGARQPRYGVLVSFNVSICDAFLHFRLLQVLQNLLRAAQSPARFLDGLASSSHAWTVRMTLHVLCFNMLAYVLVLQAVSRLSF